MLFMAKSALCIGIVSALALEVAGGHVRDTLKDGTREAAAGLGRACAASKDCVGFGARLASAAVAQPGAIADGLVETGLAAASDTLAVPQAAGSPISGPVTPGAGVGRPARHARRPAPARE